MSAQTVLAEAMAPAEDPAVKEAVRDRIRDFAAATFLVGAGEVGPDTDLFEANVIDSFGFVELVSFLEQTFGIAIEEDDLTSPEMATLAGIERVVTGKLRQQGALR
ncbi:acyl carrier protein [Methylobacterium nonmethylotrophicum]|nr:acyl carrier protein [Methylobacterium nonmethylotrophicum]